MAQPDDPLRLRQTRSSVLLAACSPEIRACYARLVAQEFADPIEIKLSLLGQLLMLLHLDLKETLQK
jgi:hypothetical protein